MLLVYGLSQYCFSFWFIMIFIPLDQHYAILGLMWGMGTIHTKGLAQKYLVLPVAELKLMTFQSQARSY